MEAMCRLTPFAEVGGSAAASLPSYWCASIVFFFTFVFVNGLSLYNFAKGDQSNTDKVGARKTHAVIGMALSLLFGFGLLIWRGTSGCENVLGLALSLVFIGVAIGFFKLFEGCGLLRIVDLYGIGARLLPTSATAAPTQVCFPVDPN
jgi:divalent metal cation (Fe/Co/Zn/Cd) transporter